MLVDGLQINKRITVSLQQVAVVSSDDGFYCCTMTAQIGLLLFLIKNVHNLRLGHLRKDGRLDASS